MSSTRRRSTRSISTKRERSDLERDDDDVIENERISALMTKKNTSSTLTKTRKNGDEDDYDDYDVLKEKKLRILLVEDDISTSLIITSMLTQAGASVTTASNGRQALESLANNRSIDLILTDIMMPEVDGIELCEIIRKNPKLKEVPVIVMSVSDRLESTGEALDSEKAHAIGAEQFLQKPLSKDMCASVVGNHHRLPPSNNSSSSSLLANRRGICEGSENNNTNNTGSDDKGSGGSDDPTTFKLHSKVPGAAQMDRWTKKWENNNDEGSSFNINDEYQILMQKKGAIENKSVKLKANVENVNIRPSFDEKERVTPVMSTSTEVVRKNIISQSAEQKKLFSGLSVQLVRAHGGPTAVLELALTPQSQSKVAGNKNEHLSDSDRVKLRRSESRSAFQSFIKQNENKNVAVETVNLPIDPMSMVFPNLMKEKSGGKETTVAAAPSRLSKKRASATKEMEAAELLLQYQTDQNRQQQIYHQQQFELQKQYQMQLQQQHHLQLQMQMQFYSQQQNFMNEPSFAAASNMQAYQNVLQSFAHSQQQLQQQAQISNVAAYSHNINMNHAAVAAALFGSSAASNGFGMFPYLQQNQDYVTSFVQALASAVEKAPLTLGEQQNNQQRQQRQQHRREHDPVVVATGESVPSRSPAAMNDTDRSASTCAERRAHAIARFLKKRKERNFEKKVRYASRKKLAESRPRVKGQFVKKSVVVTDEQVVTEK